MKVGGSRTSADFAERIFVAGVTKDNTVGKAQVKHPEFGSIVV